MYSDFGMYPKNTVFGNFKVDYKKDLAEYNTETKFYYTNSTNSSLKKESKLKEIAGFGNSEVINYDGLGAYFLDKLSNGVWRLEVMPDAVWIDNLFGRNSPNKKVAVINWSTHLMQINLKDLGDDFRVEAINEGNEFLPEIKGKSFQIWPGTYIISKEGVSKKWSKKDDFKAFRLNDFYAPEANVDKLYLKHESAEIISDNEYLKIEVQCIAPEMPKALILTGFINGEYFNQEFKYLGKYKYEAIIPSNDIKKGFLNYNIIVKQKNGVEVTYPSGKEGNLYSWDFYDRTPYKVTVVSKESPIYLFDAIKDSDDLVKEWKKSFKLVPIDNFGEAEYQMNIEKLFVTDKENLYAQPIYDYSFKHFIIDKIKDRKTDLLSKKTLIFKGRALNDKPCKLQIAFVLDDGSAYGNVIEIGTETKEYLLNLDDLKPVKTVTLPRPYPSFLPYYLEYDISSDFDISRAESLQFSIGPDIPVDEFNNPHGIAIINVSLK